MHTAALCLASCLGIIASVQSFTPSFPAVLRSSAVSFIQHDAFEAGRKVHPRLLRNRRCMAPMCSAASPPAAEVTLLGEDIPVRLILLP